MGIQHQLQEKIVHSLDPLHYNVTNESHLHRPSNNKDSHYSITIVSNAFEGMSAVKRHQKIYQLFSEELETCIHALSLHIYSSTEWDDRKQKMPTPTPCKHL